MLVQGVESQPSSKVRRRGRSSVEPERENDRGRQRSTSLRGPAADPPPLSLNGSHRVDCASSIIAGQGPSWLCLVATRPDSGLHSEQEPCEPSARRHAGNERAQRFPLRLWPAARCLLCFQYIGRCTPHLYMLSALRRLRGGGSRSQLFLAVRLPKPSTSDGLSDYRWLLFAVDTRTWRHCDCTLPSTLSRRCESSPDIDQRANRSQTLPASSRC